MTSGENGTVNRCPTLLWVVHGISGISSFRRARDFVPGFVAFGQRFRFGGVRERETARCLVPCISAKDKPKEPRLNSPE
jgi:hypothetical protein